MKTVGVWCRKGGEGKTLWSQLLCGRMMQHQPEFLVLYCSHDKQEDGLVKALRRKTPPIRGVLYGTFWNWQAVWDVEQVWERVRDKIPYKLLVFDLPPATEELGVFSKLKLIPDLWLIPIHTKDAWNNTLSAKPILQKLGGKRYWLPTGVSREVALEMEETLRWQADDKVLSPIPGSDLLGKAVPDQCVPPWSLAPSDPVVGLAMRACDDVLGALFRSYELLAPLPTPNLRTVKSARKR